MASLPIPIIFPAVKMPNGFHGDGRVRQLTRLAPPVHLGATRILNLLLKDRPEGIAGPDGLKPVELLMLRPSRDLGALARGYEDRLPAKVRLVVNSMGGKREGSSDFVSYLLFDPAFADKLVELGYNDARGQWEKIEDFLGDGARRQGAARRGEG